MSKSINLIIIAALISCSLCFIDRETYDQIKSKAAFEVMDYEEHQKIFEGMTYEGMSVWNGENRLISNEMRERLEIETSKSFLAMEPILKGLTLPAEFDWRKVRPECFTPVKDQKNCGSCYSFSGTAALETRICIALQGKIQVELSQQDIISCDVNNQKCVGDRLDNTWRYLENVGTCNLSCKPYESAFGFIPACYNSCTNPAYTFARWRASPGTWKIMNNVDQIKAEIYMHGPVSAGIATYEDLATYRGGIYIHTAGRKTDYHAVVIVGWAYDATYQSEYWILRNSWGPAWGEQGHFKVLFNYYEVNDYVNASLPLV